MSIIRAPRPEGNFAIIRNDVLRDSALSFKARGILASLLSRPDNWATTIDALANEGPDGKEAVRTGLKELEDRGYLVRSTQRQPDGRFTSHNYVFDEPQAAPAEPAVADFPSPGNPSPDNRLAIEVPKKNTKPPLTPALATATAGQGAAGSFEAFWAAYPRRIGKRAAAAAYKQALRRGNSHETIMGGIEKAKRSEQWTRDAGRFIPHPSTWLNQDRFLDELPSGPRRPFADAL